MFLTDDIVTGAMPSVACVFKDPPVVNWKVASRTIPIDTNAIGVSPIATTQVLTVTGTGTGISAPLIHIRSQEVGIPRGSIGLQKVRNAHPFKTYSKVATYKPT